MPTALDKVIYTARATTTGGREGTSRSDDGLLDVKLSPPKAMGAPAPPPTRNSCLRPATRPASWAP